MMTSNKTQNSNLLMNRKICDKCKYEVEEVFKTPRCKHHFYCKKCLSSDSFHIFCEKCKRFFDLSNSNHDSRSLCNLCGVFSDENTRFCSNNHFYCKACEGSLFLMDFVPYSRFLSCLECKIELENRKKPINERRILKNNQSMIDINYSPYCETTYDHNSQTAFDCNHNFCYDCIYRHYMIHAVLFAMMIKKRNVYEIRHKFVIKCMKNDCNNTIRLPFMQIHPFLSSLADFDHLEILMKFMPYLDGIKCLFFICECKMIVGKIGKILINCECRHR